MGIGAGAETGIEIGVRVGIRARSGTGAGNGVYRARAWPRTMKEDFHQLPSATPPRASELSLPTMSVSTSGPGGGEEGGALFCPKGVPAGGCCSYAPVSCSSVRPFAETRPLRSPSRVTRREHTPEILRKRGSELLRRRRTLPRKDARAPLAPLWPPCPWSPAPAARH